MSEPAHGVTLPRAAFDRGLEWTIAVLMIAQAAVGLLLPQQRAPAVVDVQRLEAVPLLHPATQGRSVLGPLTGGSVDWLFVSLLLFLSILPLVPLVFLPRGRDYEAAMATAEASGDVTPELQAAWRDPVVRAAHVYELGSVTVVLILMLAKPF